MSAVGMTNKRAQEIISCGKDPKYFINKYVFIQHPIRGTIKFDTFPFQDECLDDFVKHRFNIILKSRQMGLSTLTAAYSVWLAIFRRDKNILVIATKLKTAQNFIRKVKVIIRKMPKWLMLPEVTGNNKQEIQFSNGSVIQAIPTSDDAGRSEALSLAIIDEAAFIRNFDIIWTSLYSTLSTGGRGIILSTPNGVGDKYHELYSHAELGENEFNPIKLPWSLHPERDEKWFANETKNMSRKQIAQELMCDFTTSGNTFISNETINSLLYHVQEPIERSGPGSNLWIWKYPQTGTDYVISADVSRGDANDYSAFHVIDTKKSEIVAEFKGKIRPDQFAELLYDAGKRFGNAVVCPESNTFGYAVIMKLHDKGYKNLYYKNPKDKFESLYGSNPNLHKIGFSTQGQSRNQILTKLEEVLRNQKIIIRSTRCIDELKTFVYNGTRAQAMKGKNDDLVMSLAIGVWLYEQSENKSTANTSISDAMLAAFAVNKPPANDGNNQESSLVWSPSEKNIATDARFISSANVYNKHLSQGSERFASEFGWLIKG
jgi:hypothetical protein